MCLPPVSVGTADGATVCVAVVLLCFGDSERLAVVVAEVKLAADTQLPCMLLGVNLVVKTRVTGLIAVDIVMMIHNSILSAYI